MKIWTVYNLKSYNLEKRMQIPILQQITIAKRYKNRKEDISKWEAKAVPQCRSHLTLSLKNNCIQVKEQRERENMICVSKKDDGAQGKIKDMEKRTRKQKI